MLPTRSRLESWNPDALNGTAQEVRAAGKEIQGAVTTLSTNIRTMPDSRSWSGDAHTAATAMFERADKRATSFADFTGAIAAALEKGAGDIGKARKELLDRVAEIEADGQLYVNDAWVVLIKGAKLTLEEVAALEKRAQAEQFKVNSLLAAVGEADDDTADAIGQAARPHGFEVPELGGLESILLPGVQQPQDEVPDPTGLAGQLQQAMIRDADMSVTVRDQSETKIEYDPNTGEPIEVTTFYMQDGGWIVERKHTKPFFSDRSPEIIQEQYNKDGQKVAEKRIVRYKERARQRPGILSETTHYPDGSWAEKLTHPDGREEIIVHPKNQPPTYIPPNLLGHPIADAFSAGISYVDYKVGKEAARYSPELVESVKIGSKVAGPALGIATTLMDVIAAQSGRERCIAIFEGSFSVGASVLAGIAYTPVTGPGAVVLAIASGKGGQLIGNVVGNLVC